MLIDQSVCIASVAATGPFDTVVAQATYIIPPGRFPPTISQTNVSGKILLCDEIRYTFFLDWALSPQVRASGLLALAIVDGDEISMGGLGSDILRGVELPFPLVGIDFKTRDAIRAMNLSTAVAVLDSVGLKTPWREVQEHGMFWFSVVLIIATSLALAILGVGRLIQYWTVEGQLNINIAKVVIIFETVGAILRLIYWIVDPLGYQGIWSDSARTVWHTISVPFAVNSTLLITFYWHETVSRTSVKFSWSIERLKIPAYLLATCIFSTEVIIDGLIIAKAKLPGLELSNAIVYLIIALGLSIFFLITAGRVLFQLSKFTLIPGKSRSHRKAKLLIPVAVKLIIAGICWIAIVAVCLITLSDAFYPRWEPKVVSAVWIVVHLAVTAKGISTVLALRPPRKGFGTASHLTSAAGHSSAVRSSTASIEMSSTSLSQEASPI
jgi:hypothetical protein